MTEKELVALGMRLNQNGFQPLNNTDARAVISLALKIRKERDALLAAMQEIQNQIARLANAEHMRNLQKEVRGDTDD